MRLSRMPIRALVLVLAIALGSSLPHFSVLISHAAAGTLSSITQTVVNDGTAPFDAGAGAGLDAGASNGIIRTRDSFDVDWNYVVASAGDVTFTETLSSAMWDSSSAGACSQGASAISADKKTITCTLTNLAIGSGSYRVRAIADGAAANGSSITGVVSGGSTQSTSLSITVSATPKMNIGSMDLFPVVSNGPGVNSSISGYNFDVPVAMWADVNGAFNGTSGLRGLEALASPITFQAEPSSAQAVLVSCSAGAAGGTRPSFPDPSGGNGTTVLNAARNSGSWSCTQSGVGAPVAVTVTGADSSLNSYPTKSANNSAITTNRAYFADGFVRLWIPKTATTANATTTFSTRVTQFDPVSASGASNYLTGYSPNQPDPGTCVTGSYANCSSIIVNRVPQAVRPDVRIEDANMGALPGSSVAWDGLGQVTANTKYYASLVSSVPVANDTMTNVTMCMKWDPAQSQIDGSKPILSAANGLSATIEYGSTVYSMLSSYQAADCGRPGTGTNWHSSISAAGGAAAITAVRITFNGVLTSGMTMSADIPQISSAGLSAGAYIGYFGSLSSVETAELGSTYNPATGAGVSGSRVTYLEARTGVSVAWDTSTSSVPAVREVTVTPSLLAGQTARDTTVVVTLPSACFEYVPGSASISPSAIVPANLGPDGIACTSDDISGTRLEFAFGDISANPSPITLRTNILPAIPLPSNQTVGASIASPSDPVSSSAHTSSATLSVAAVAGFSIAKTADTGRVSNGVPFNYSINWRNGSASQSGGVKIVDVLPFAGDTRGSSGFTGLSVNSVTVPAGAVVEYSTLDSATALSLVDSAPDGENAAFAWTATKPSNVTAVRIVIANLAAGASGVGVLNVSATGVQAGGKLKNDLYGVATFASAPIKAAVPLEIQTLGTASLAVTKTSNLSEITSAGQSLRYTIRVTNTGQEALSSITVTDIGFTGTGNAPTVDCPAMILSPGASMDCQTSIYSVTQADLDTLTGISNQATATGTPPAGSPVSATDTVSTPVRASSSLTLTQIPSPNSLSQAGSTVTYSFTATNAGTRTLSNLTVESQSFNGLGALSTISCAATVIAPNSSVLCTASYTVTQTDLDSLPALIHRAIATAIDSGSASVQSNSTQTTVPLTRQPAITLSKSAAVAAFGSAGASVPFVFTVTNTGNVTLAGVGIDETEFTGTGALGSVVCAATTVAPGAAVTCTAAYSATQADFNVGSITNRAKAHASFSGTPVTSSESTVTVNAVGVAPGVSIATTSDLEYVAFSDDEINYSIVITNTGNVSLTGITPSIPVNGFSGNGALTSSSISCPSSTLNPMASMTCTLHYTVTQQDIDTLSWIDLDTAVSATAGSTLVSASAQTVNVEVAPVAHLDVAATPSMSSATKAGDTVTFSLMLVNDGAFTLTNVVASVSASNFNGHGILGAVQCPTALSLAPGQSGICTVSYTITQEDIDELASLTLTADAQGEYAAQTYDTRIQRDANDTAEVQLAPRVNLSMVKTASLPILNAAGDEIVYEFEVTNLSTRTIYNVSVAEVSFNGGAALDAPTCPDTLQVMAPGDSAVCTASYTSVANDMNQSEIRNTAKASADTGPDAGASSFTSLNSTATVSVKSSNHSDSGGDDSLLTLTGASTISQLVAGFIAVMLGGLTMLTYRVRRRA